jgi:glycosyltransferase involved in cell wall biosynthesis
MDKINTFSVAVVLPTFINRFLETLEKYTEPNYQVIVVDNSREGVLNRIHGKVTCYLRPHHNLGFAQSHNIAMKLATTRYITCANDDVEFVDNRWWQGILETFAQNGDNVVAVNPSSIKIPGWGYGLPGDFYLLPYQESYTKQDYDFLLSGKFDSVPDLPATYPRQSQWVIDGIATWCTVFDTERMNTALAEEKHQFGVENPYNLYFDEKFYPGGGEDYDLNARMYRLGRRMIGTSRSWVYHHWSSTRNHEDLLPTIEQNRVWNNLDELWPSSLNAGHKMDLWGHWTMPDGTQKPMKRICHITAADLW